MQAGTHASKAWLPGRTGLQPAASPATATQQRGAVHAPGCATLSWSVAALGRVTSSTWRCTSSTVPSSAAATSPLAPASLSSSLLLPAALAPPCCGGRCCSARITVSPRLKRW